MGLRDFEKADSDLLHLVRCELVCDFEQVVLVECGDLAADCDRGWLVAEVGEAWAGIAVRAGGKP